jgi:hypothetical protein
MSLWVVVLVIVFVSIWDLGTIFLNRIIHEAKNIVISSTKFSLIIYVLQEEF